MHNTLSNNTIGFFLIWLIIPAFIGVRCYIKRRNASLSIAEAFLAFSICQMIGQTILPIPLFYAPDPDFRLETGIIFLNFDQYFFEFLFSCLIFFCYFIIFAFFIRCIFRPMQKFWMATLVIIAIIVGSAAYILLRNLLYGDVVEFLDFYRVIMELLGGLLGYFLSFLLEKVNPKFYNKMNLAKSPEMERIHSDTIDLE